MGVEISRFLINTKKGDFFLDKRFLAVTVVIRTNSFSVKSGEYASVLICEPGDVLGHGGGNPPAAPDQQGLAVLDRLDPGRALITKSNLLVEARYHLTMAEHKVLLILLAQLAAGERSAERHMYVSATALRRVFGGDKSNSYKDLRLAVCRLLTRALNADRPLLAQGERSVFVHHIRYWDHHGAISAALAPFLLEQTSGLSGQYTRYPLTAVAGLSTPYALRLYENMRRWLATGSYTLSTARLRRMMMLENKYPRARDLYKRVVAPALVEINAHSDLFVQAKRRYGQDEAGGVVFRIRGGAPAAAPAPACAVTGAP